MYQVCVIFVRGGYVALCDVMSACCACMHARRVCGLTSLGKIERTSRCHRVVSQCTTSTTTDSGSLACFFYTERWVQHI